MLSDNIKQGVERAPNRSLLYALGLTDEEIRMLPQGAYTMTLECGMRFLTDYLDGDKYFSTDHDKHNLERAHTQFKLVEDMEAKWDDMTRIVQEEVDMLRMF